MFLLEILRDVLGPLAGILGGYLAAVATQFLLNYLISREGRGVLMAGGRMSRACWVQLGLSWMLSGAVGSVVTLRMYPDMPMAAGSVLAVAFLLSFALMRSRNKSPRQQTIADTVLTMICVLVGLTAPAYVHISQQNPLR